MDESGKFFLDPEANEAMIPAANAVATQSNARVYYQIFVGSFSDSNGDGIGDLRGIINRMDYLNDGDPNSGLSLGIEGDPVAGPVEKIQVQLLFQSGDRGA